MMQVSIFRHNTFEPLVASLGFLVNIWGWRIIDKYFLIFRKFRIQKTDYQPDTLLGIEHGTKSALAYMILIGLFDQIYPRNKFNPEAPLISEIILKLVLGIFLYDFIFFWIHLAMHRIPYLYKNVHYKHHSKTPLVASEVVRHSFIDGSLQVLTNIFVLNVLKSHPLIRLIHNIVITTMLTETHSGYDMPHMIHNLVPFNIFGGSVRHEIHHKNGITNYQQFFTYLDNLLVQRKY